MIDPFTSTINLIPKDISQLKQSEIPFVINVAIEHFKEENTPFSIEEIIRCEKCKTYLNPFVEIFPPGNLWKCNMCLYLNKTESLLMTKQRFSQSNDFCSVRNFINNTKGSEIQELKELKLDVIAPPSFSSKPPSDPVFFFLIEATNLSIKNGMLSSVLNSISNNISLIPNSSGRTKIMVAFFNSYVYILRKGERNNFAVVPDFSELPAFFSDDFVFKPEELKLETQNLVDFFVSLNENANDFGGGLSVLNKIMLNGTSLLFLASVPSVGNGKIGVEKGTLKCKSNFYKSITGDFTIHQTGIHLFLFPNFNIELPTLSILSKFTGGSIFYYPNYNSENPSFNSKFVSDFCSFCESEIGFDSVCRVRVPEGVKIEEYFGNLTLRSNGILSFPNYVPGHSFSFEIKIKDDFKQSDLTIQVALLKTLENGDRIIKLLNFIIPNENSLLHLNDKSDFGLFSSFFRNKIQQGNSFFDFLNEDALTHHLALKGIYNETVHRGEGNTFLTNFIKKISANFKKILKIGTKGLSLPPSLNNLPLKVLSLMKSVPLRPSSYTPMDFKAYYIYLFYTQYPSFINNLIMPSLYAIHLLNGDEGLIMDDEVIMPQPIRLTLNCLETNGLYLLDTGVNFYFFVGKDCDEEFAYLALENNEGPFLFSTYDNEISLRISNILSHLRSNRFISPGYFVIRDRDQPNLLMDIFFGYFVEDAVHGLPDLNGFMMNLND